MPYDNEYNRKISNDVDAMNKKYLLNEVVTLDPKVMAEFHGSGKLSGGFLGALAGAVLPMVLSNLMGSGMHRTRFPKKNKEEDLESVESSMSEEEEKDEKMAGGAVYNNMRDKMEGKGKASKPYKKQSEKDLSCGFGMSGGSGFGLGEGTVRDTGVGLTVGQNMRKIGGKRGRKSKMGAGLSGSSRSDPIRPEQFYPKVLEQSAPTATKAVSPTGVVDKALNIGSNMSGMGKRGRKKASSKMSPKKEGRKRNNPWLDLVNKVRKERPELKGLKAIVEYIKKNNLYKK